MTSPIEPRTASLYHAARTSAVEPLIAVMIVLATLATYLVVAVVMPRDLALIAAQLTLAAVPIASVFVVRQAQPPGPTLEAIDVLGALGLRRAPLRSYAAATAIGATAWYINIRIVSLLPLPEHPAKVLEQLVERPSLPTAFVMFVVLPALCEELMFRGVFARALGRPLPLAAAAAISALVFAAYHMSVVQALPTLTLGFALAVLAIRADSALPGMIAHALNNAIAIALSRGELSGLAGWLDRNPGLALAGCAATTGAGIALAVRGRR